MFCLVSYLTFSVNSRGHQVEPLKQPYKGEYFVVITLPISPYRKISCVKQLKVRHFKCVAIICFFLEIHYANMPM